MTLCVVCATTARPVRAEIGLLCSACANAILRHLREIEACCAALDAAPGGGRGERQSPGYASTPPCRLDVVDQLDPRSRSATDEGPSALAALCSWSRLVAFERDVRQPDRISIGGECRFLRAHHEWITRQPWVDEYAGELRQVRDRVRGLIGMAPDRPLGQCLVVDCEAAVFATQDLDGARCSGCRRLYTGHDLARLSVAQEAA